MCRSCRHWSLRVASNPNEFEVTRSVSEGEHFMRLWFRNVRGDERKPSLTLRVT